MASSTLVSSSLQINYKVGQATNGTDKISSVKFAKVKAAATNDDIFAVGTAMGALISYPVVSLLRLDNSLVTNE